MQKMNRSLRHYIDQKKPEIKVYKLKKKSVQAVLIPFIQFQKGEKLIYNYRS